MMVLMIVTNDDGNSDGSDDVDLGYSNVGSNGNK